mgnify:FL=1
MLNLTKPQRKALYKVYLRLDTPRPQYKAFRRNVHPGPGCVMVQFAGMVLGIEKDGYTHS